MTKIEIKRSPEDLLRVATFLKRNNIKFDIVNDSGNSSNKEADAYQKRLDKLGL